MSSFKHIATVLANDRIPVHKYKSELTGVTIVIGEVEGPLVNGYFALATEAHDDDGLPHTLEHLIFLGSELYPYKGVLDLLANRCLASGTNAWTDTDHTCYTVQTVGKDGFLELMPIYLDHILYPTLSDAGFITEVHHVSGDGDDGGVVYCEMQGRENSAESLAWLQLVRKIYPDSGYSAETGGIMHNLRTSTTNEKVRKFHSDFYRPENLTLIITGQIKIDDIEKSFEPFEKRILCKPKKEPFERPWHKPVQNLSESFDKRIVYASDCEDCGLVYVGWRGPNCTTDNYSLTACSVLLRYLSETSVSPLQRELVEIADPYASTVAYNIVENFESLLMFSFENVPIEKIDLIVSKMRDILTNIADGNEQIDMKRMQNILERCILEYFSSMESSPHEALTFPVIADALYGNTLEDFSSRLNINKTMKSLLSNDAIYWIDLLKKFLINGHYVAIRAVPSSEEQKRMAKEEAARIEAQRNSLGPEGLAKKGEELCHAMATNEIPPPSEMLTSVPIPDVSNINSLPSTIQERGKNVIGDEHKLSNLILDKFPLHVTACHIDTEFYYITTYFNTDTLAPELRKYLLLFFDLITESPVRCTDGTLLPYEKVVAALESDTVSLQTAVGMEACRQFTCGTYSQTAQLTMKVDYHKYKLGIQWVIDLLRNTEFTVERIRVCAAKISNAVSQAKRKGNVIVTDQLNAMFFTPNSNSRLCSMIHQHRFLTALIEQLEIPTSAQKIIDDLNCIRNEIVKTKSMCLYVAADWKKVLSDSSYSQYDAWKNLINSNDIYVAGSIQDPIPDYKLHKENPAQSQILGIGCVEGAYLVHAVRCNITVDHELYVPLLLFMQYLTQLEGPFWRQIRGTGLSYGYSMNVTRHSQLLTFTLYRSTNVSAAFKHFKLLTEAQLSETSSWEPELLESARSSLIFEWIEREKSVSDVVSANLIANCFRRSNRISDENQSKIHRLQEVTIPQMELAGKKFVTQLFTSNARTSVVCHPDKAAEISTEFKQFGIELNVSSNIETSVLAQLDD